MTAPEASRAVRLRRVSLLSQSAESQLRPSESAEPERNPAAPWSSEPRAEADEAGRLRGQATATGKHSRIFSGFAVWAVSAFVLAAEVFISRPISPAG